MAFELKQLVQVDISGDFLWSTDYTKEYDVTSNPTGWGAPNFNLSESALVLVAMRGDVPLEFVGTQIKYSSSAPNTLQNQWQMKYPSKDGWIRFWLMRIWVSTDGVTDVTGDHLLEEGDFFYIPDFSDKIFEKLGSSESGYEEVTDFSLLTQSTDPANPFVVMCEDLFYNKIAKYKNNVLYKDYQRSRLKDDCQERDELLGKMNDIMHNVQGADYAFRSGLPLQANDILETIMDDYQIV